MFWITHTAVKCLHNLNTHGISTNEEVIDKISVDLNTDLAVVAEVINIKAVIDKVTESFKEEVLFEYPKGLIWFYIKHHYDIDTSARESTLRYIQFDLWNKLGQDSDVFKIISE